MTMTKLGFTCKSSILTDPLSGELGVMFGERWVYFFFDFQRNLENSLVIWRDVLKIQRCTYPDNMIWNSLSKRRIQISEGHGQRMTIFIFCSIENAIEYFIEARKSLKSLIKTHLMLGFSDHALPELVALGLTTKIHKMILDETWHLGFAGVQ